MFGIGMIVAGESLRRPVDVEVELLVEEVVEPGDDLPSRTRSSGARASAPGSAATAARR
jgi:hypothetical protein